MNQILKDKIEKKYLIKKQKNESTWPTCKTCDIGHETVITP
jgi:hypothetical protein